MCETLRVKHMFNGSERSFHTVLKNMGFKWQKDNPRRGLMELPNIVFKRIEFLRSYKAAKEENLFEFVFLDETWIFQNGTVSRSWQDQNKGSVRKIKVDGKRLLSEW